MYLVDNKDTSTFHLSGGERGIRTLDRVSPIHAFQACAFNHSAISPGCRGTVLRKRKRPRQFSLARAPRRTGFVYHYPACYDCLLRLVGLCFWKVWIGGIGCD